MTDIAANVARVRERMARAAERSGRSPDSIRLIAASKSQPVELVVEAIRAGVTEIGENYVQEAASKIAAVDLPVRWHLIGHLQRNKVARAVQLFEVIQTVDSLELADALDRRGEKLGRQLRALIEVNVGGEASKRGVAPERVAEFVEALMQRQHLKVEGLMTIPPMVSPKAARSYFISLRRLRECLAATVAELSMGMTDDFEVAIEEGATMVRVGRAIFGPRD
jgi:pyridoxal phosphate enzyme (YggS family)